MRRLRQFSLGTEAGQSAPLRLGLGAKPSSARHLRLYCRGVGQIAAPGYTASLIAQGGVRIFWTNWRNGALYKSECVPAISGRRAAKSSPEKSPSRVRIT